MQVIIIIIIDIIIDILQSTLIVRNLHHMLDNIY